jgi:hypothetical protein
MTMDTFYEYSTPPKKSSIFLNARDQYRSRFMIAGILAGVLLESTAMIILREPSTLCILFSWATNCWFDFLIEFSIFLTNFLAGKYYSSPRFSSRLFWLILMSVFLMLSLWSETAPNLPKKQEHTELERSFALTLQSSIAFVTSLFGWLALATIIFVMTGSQYCVDFQPFFSSLRNVIVNVIVFVGACSLGANTCLFIASLIGAIPVVYDATVFLSLVVCRLVLIVAAWIQEKLIFEDVETTRIEKETEKGDDTQQYSIIC